MGKTCTVDGCGAPHFGQGYCNLHYWRLVRNPKRAQRIARCAWCGDRKPIAKIRHPDSSRGPTPSHCQQCRDNHPDEAWCDFHAEAHSKTAFTPIDRPIGVGANCVLAESQKMSRKRGLPSIICAACLMPRETWEFRGGRAKSVTCRTCEDANPDLRWCLDCAGWLPRAAFTPTGLDGKYLSSRCVPCRTANTHGVTVAMLLERQGIAEPECGACGSKDFLKIDHDHSHCPASTGCSECVRGYLCHGCNTSEGLLKTVDRARKLLAYMERTGIA